MTYKGVVCDQSKRLKQPYMTREACDTCVQEPNHPCPFNGKMLAMMWSEGNRGPSSSFSPTKVLGCPRAMYLTQNSYPQTFDPRRKWPSMRGTMAHGFFEDTPLAPGVQFEIVEEKLETTIETAYGPQKFVGKPDLVEVLHYSPTKVVVKLTDWKSTREVGHDFIEAKEDHQKQVNMYAYLLAKTLPAYLNLPDCEVVVDELEILYFDMGKVRRFTTKCDLVDRGKMLLPRARNEYAPLDLYQMSHRSIAFMESFIRDAIEDAIEAREKLSPAYEGDKAKLCPYCAFYSPCMKLQKEGR